MKIKRKTSELGYILLTPIMRILFKLYYNPKIINKEYIPKNGSIIIAGNHKHIFDQCLTIMATKRPIHYMAKKEYFDGIFSFFFKFVGCISVDRTKKDKKATETAIKILNNGGAIGIFPEGTRNKTNEKLLPFKFGTVSMAKKTNSYIVPFAIMGDFKFRSKNLTIIFDKPFKVGDMDLETANDLLRKKIINLLNNK